MSLISGNIKDILSFKLKQRYDGITDQFNRIIMVKMLIIFSIITSMEFFSDKMTCVQTHEGSISEDFLHNACWIRGFFVYKELVDRPDISSYYGMPTDVEIDGVEEDNPKSFCRQISRVTDIRNNHCQPLTKVYYLQYQYFPFYIASLAIAFYIPYLIFGVVNSDMMNLKTAIKEASNEQDTINIVELYFNYKNNGGVFVLRFKVFATVVTKFCYVIVSVCSFLFTDRILGNKYRNYGVNWLYWTRLNNTLAYGHDMYRGFPKPGEDLLPSMGFCDITEGLSNRIKTRYNVHRVICEISTHIIYQYVLLVLWYLFVLSITLSCMGLLHYTVKSTYTALCGTLCFGGQGGRGRALYKFTVREIEYIEFVRVKQLALYKQVMERFKNRMHPHLCAVEKSGRH